MPAPGGAGGRHNMKLEHVLKTVVERLRSDKLTDEEHVKHSVVLPILRALEWDDTDPSAFKSQYVLENGKRVDYALLVEDYSRRGRGEPMVFVEAKRRGDSGPDGEEQLFQYATNRGVPLLLLTDGDRWDFYLSMAAGEYADRKFCELDLSKESALAPEPLQQYLAREAVVSGAAKQRAEETLRRRLERRRARDSMPEVWRELLRDADEVLCDRLASQVKKKCGVEPDEDHVRQFLSDRARDTTSGRMSLSVPPEARRGIRQPVSIPSGRAEGRRQQERPEAHETLIGKPRYHRPVLRVLCGMDDGAVAGEVLDRVERLVEAELTDWDRSLDNSGHVRWKHAVRGALHVTKERGLIDQDPVSMAYRITKEGREFLRS